MEYVIYKDHEAIENPLPQPTPCLAQKDHQLPILDHDVALTFHCQKLIFLFRKPGSVLNRCSVLGY